MESKIAETNMNMFSLLSNVDRFDYLYTRYDANPKTPELFIEELENTRKMGYGNLTTMIRTLDRTFTKQNIKVIYDVLIGKHCYIIKLIGKINRPEQLILQDLQQRSSFSLLSYFLSFLKKPQTLQKQQFLELESIPLLNQRSIYSGNKKKLD